MSELGGPGRPEERGGQEAAAGGSARGGGAGRASSGGQGLGREQSNQHRRPARRIPAPARIAAAILGPVLLTVGYFALPFAPIGGGHRVLRWVVLVGLLSVLAVGMLLTTVRAMTVPGGHSGVGILLLAWASILVFAASYWSVAAHRGEFVGLSTRLDALYFTGVTMATVGYGDIHPSGQLARAVVLVQLLYTFAFLAGGVAALGTRTRARLAERGGGGQRRC